MVSEQPIIKIGYFFDESLNQEEIFQGVVREIDFECARLSLFLFNLKSSPFKHIPIGCDSIGID